MPEGTRTLLPQDGTAKPIPRQASPWVPDCSSYPDDHDRKEIRARERVTGRDPLGVLPWVTLIGKCRGMAPWVLQAKRTT